MTAHVSLESSKRPPAAPRRFELLIDGKWQQAMAGERLTRHSPAHGVAVSDYACGSSADAAAAVAAARRAFDDGPWPRMTASARARALLKVADIVERRLEELAVLEVLESGKPIAQARAEISGAADIWRYAATLARTLHGESYANLGDDMLGVVLREPIGVVAIITPWNFPFLILSQKLPFALAAGCTSVVKPSELTSGTSLVLGDILLQADIPPGVVNIVVGTGAEVGERLIRHPDVDMVSFTGSTAIGKHVMAAGSDTLKKVTAELGGKNPQIVFGDADLDAAADAAVFGIYFNAGECCNSSSRLLVAADIASAFVERVIAASKKVVVGDPLDDATKVGAIITPEHLAKITDYVEQATAAGAELRLGGRPLDTTTGQFMAPTVIDGVRPDMTIAREEVFGPVLSIMTFDNADEAIRVANDTNYGLSAGVWSGNFDNCMHLARGIKAGTVWLNTFMDGYAELPFGGYKQSGLGRELGKHAVEDFTETKTLQMHRGPRTNWWLR